MRERLFLRDQGAFFSGTHTDIQVEIGNIYGNRDGYYIAAHPNNSAIVIMIRQRGIWSEVPLSTEQGSSGGMYSSPTAGQRCVHGKIFLNEGGKEFPTVHAYMEYYARNKRISCIAFRNPQILEADSKEELDISLTPLTREDKQLIIKFLNTTHHPLKQHIAENRRSGNWIALENSEDLTELPRIAYSAWGEYVETRVFGHIRAGGFDILSLLCQTLDQDGLKEPLLEKFRENLEIASSYRTNRYYVLKETDPVFLAQLRKAAQEYFSPPHEKELCMEVVVTKLNGGVELAEHCASFLGRNLSSARLTVPVLQSIPFWKPPAAPQQPRVGHDERENPASTCAIL